MQFVDFLQDMTLSFLYTFIFSINCDFVQNMCVQEINTAQHTSARGGQINKQTPKIVGAPKNDSTETRETQKSN